MNIAYISRLLPALSETFVVSELRALRKRGITITPFSVHAPGKGEYQENAQDIRDETIVVKQPANPAFWFSHFKYLFGRPGRYFSTLWKYVIKPSLGFKDSFRALAQFMLAPFMASRMQKAGVQHVHAHFAHIATGVAMMASRLAGTTFSFTIHAYGLYYDTMLLQEKLRDTSFVSLEGQYNIDYLREHHPASRDKKLVIVRNSMNPYTFDPGNRKPAETPLIVAVARLVPMKGFDTLIKSCVQLADEFPGLRCEIAGDGPIREELQEQIDSLGLQKTVILRGKMMQEELPELLNRAWVYALPCCIRDSSDNLPVALMESLSMEIPTVTTTIRAIPELVVHEKTGLLVEPDDMNQLATAIRRLIKDQQYGLELGRRGRQHVIDNFSAEVSAETLDTEFRHSIAHRSDEQGQS